MKNASMINSNRGHYYRFYTSILVWFYIINGIHGQQQMEEIGIQDIPNFITSNETYHVISGTDLEIVCQVTQSNVDIIISYESFDSQHSQHQKGKYKILSVGHLKIDRKRSFKVIPLSDGVKIKMPKITEDDSGYYKCSLALPQQESQKVIFTIEVISQNSSSSTTADYYSNSSGNISTQNYLQFYLVILLIVYVLWQNLRIE